MALAASMRVCAAIPTEAHGLVALQLRIVLIEGRDHRHQHFTHRLGRVDPIASGIDVGVEVGTNEQGERGLPTWACFKERRHRGRLSALVVTTATNRQFCILKEVGESRASSSSPFSSASDSLCAGERKLTERRSPRGKDLVLG
jgi:hypothetical protein